MRHRTAVIALVFASAAMIAIRGARVYRDFPTTDIRNGGQFDGTMVEAVVSS